LRDPRSSTLAVAASTNTATCWRLTLLSWMAMSQEGWRPTTVRAEERTTRSGGAPSRLISSVQAWLTATPGKSGHDGEGLAVPDGRDCQARRERLRSQSWKNSISGGETRAPGEVFPAVGCVARRLLVRCCVADSGLFIGLFSSVLSGAAPLCGVQLPEPWRT
jgi:hypothetical protein